ncbi:MAG: flagellin [Halohasta sp.]
MGFSVSASTAIIFAGLFLTAGTLYPSVSNAHERVTDAEIERTDATLDMRNTDINITVVDTTDPSIGVKNEGSTSLNASDIDVVIDGEYQPRETYDSDGLLVPGEQITIENFEDFDDFSSVDRVKIVTDHGISDS